MMMTGRFFIILLFDDRACVEMSDIMAISLANVNLMNRENQRLP
jgi:hypothetical protein